VYGMNVCSRPQIQMVGNPEADLVVFDATHMGDDVEDDLVEVEVGPEARAENLKKLECRSREAASAGLTLTQDARLSTVQVRELSPAREGCKLLVLDVGADMFCVCFSLTHPQT
jgi:hypothetical protein